MGEIVNWRRIPPRIESAAVGTNYSRIRITLAPVLDYVKTEKRYLIELEFPNDIEVALFERFLRSTSIRLSFYGNSQQAKPRIFMIHPEVDDAAPAADIWKWACAEMARIQSAIAIEFPAYSAGKVVCIAKLKTNGSIAVSDDGYPVRVYGRNAMSELPRLFDNPPDTLKRHLKKCSGTSGLRASGRQSDLAARRGVSWVLADPFNGLSDHQFPSGGSHETLLISISYERTLQCS
jgi:hypothetical protein